MDTFPALPAPEQFVTWLRAVAPYIHAFRGKTFVVAFPGELVMAGRLNALVQDLGLLHAMGMRIVVVHGSRPQINEQLRLRGVPERYENGLRITDPVALECAKEASGEIRLDIEAAFSQGMPNTPMAHSAIRVVSGNLVSARPVGIVDGVDYEHTGLVRKVDTQTIQFALNGGAIALLSNLGFSATGETFNLGMEDVAASAAVALDAEKLIFVTETPGILDEDGEVISEVSEDSAEHLLSSPGRLPTDGALYLRAALRACQGGVARAHIIPFDMDGSVLLELFQHSGVGTMVVEETLEELREAGPDDVGGILALIRPLEEDGTLVRRDRALIEREVENFTVLERDGVLFGCAALYAYPEDGIGEMACLAVNPHSQGKGDGERVLTRIEKRARAAGLKRLFVLTTRTMHWFLKRGFVVADVDALPQEKRNLYNWQRRSVVLLKNL
ncbi:amino-acid N-acetyltransferase [Quisquiliibacterium transsilvanicum]|jgi:amino-acid N-acetyltransferase|uniref:Amino-acid acetyltransferase n=1 Tax=Quisquiliibacterium transsilvanicum TaxID=1549638 RepID=A0A7W8HIA7_9BURK|nr:amino-acid N-acetyltransferase [Quisquiliibacterium transsilvanicum]MBB5272392.1 amino-acid N-acetyltransferase [Quisquiliibacterium transsilvanicum]